MIIKKLNNMFHKHSRWLFAFLAIAVMIIFIMGDALGGGGGCSDKDPSGIQIGTAFGEKVTYGDLQESAKNVQIYTMVMYGSMANLNNRQLFEIYCINKRLEQLGFTVSEKQAVNLILSSGFFRKDNKFDVAGYNTYLKQHRLSEAEVIAAFRYAAAWELYMGLIEKSVAVSDAEIEDLYRRLSVSYKVRTISVKPEAFLPEVKAPTNAELRKFFDMANANPQGGYMFPAKADLLLGKLPMAAFEAEADRNLTPALFAKYKEEYKSTLPAGQNMPADAELRKEKVQADAAVLAAKVTAKIEKELAKLGRLSPDKREAKFRAIIKDNGLELTGTGMIELNEASAKALNSEALIASVLQLPAARTSTAFVDAGNARVCAFILNRVESRIMSFEDACKASLPADYRRAEAIKLAGKLLSDAKALQNPAAIVQKYQGKIETREVKGNPAMYLFQIQNPQFRIVDPLWEVLGSTKINGFTAPVMAGDMVQTAQLLERISTVDMKGLGPMIKQGLQSVIVKNKTSALLLDFLRAVQSNCKYEIDERNPQM